MQVINRDSAQGGIFRAKLVDDNGVIKANIPGIVTLSSSSTKSIQSYPEIQWCAYNKESTELSNAEEIMWIMFENGDIKKPVCISYTVVGMPPAPNCPYKYGGLGISGGVWAGNGTGGGGAGGSGAGGSNGQDLVNGRVVDALFTAYYSTPDNYSSAENRLEGGPLDAMGNTLDWTQNTCAAPKDIPFNTNIKVMDTGTEKDGQIYKVTDRGGAITVENGVYHFDLLMKDKATANAWGRRTGKAMIGGDLVTINNSSSNFNTNGTAVSGSASNYINTVGGTAAKEQGPGTGT